MASERKAMTEAAPAMLGWPFSRLPWPVKVSLLLIATGALVLAGIVASREYPRVAPRTSTELESLVAERFRDPTVEAWDGNLVGDYLVERFYIIDPATGERFVADLLKGRIDGLEVVPREDQASANVFVLGTKDMRRDRAFFNAYLKEVSHPESLPGAGRYLGALMPPGERDAFPVNYNGDISPGRPAFRIEDDDDMYGYMLRQDYKEITAPRGLSVLGYIYVLNTSDLFPVFQNEFKLTGKTLFISEMLVVDATSRENKTTFYKLQDEFPRTPRQ